MNIKVLCDDTNCTYNYDCSECDRGELLTVNIVRGVCQDKEDNSGYTNRITTDGKPIRE